MEQVESKLVKQITGRSTVQYSTVVRDTVVNNARLNAEVKKLLVKKNCWA